jgi:hypothetical protein
VTEDFSISAYEELLKEVKGAGWKIFSLKEYFCQRQAPPAFFILRHDVDRRPGRALRMAQVESSYGILSTYYFRMKRGVFDKGVIERIASMGHEIGYHYEVLDKAKGHADLARRLFTQELGAMRCIADVRTASMHGNPFSSWDNRDFWARHQPAEFGLDGEAYISMRDEGVVYVTDTGRGWNRSNVNLFDRFFNGSLGLMPSFRSTWELIRALRQKRFRRVYLQVHPNRWTSGSLEGYGQRAEDLFLNSMKLLLIRLRKRRAAL